MIRGCLSRLRKNAITTIAMLVVISSCDILRGVPFEVLSWSPGQHDASGIDPISIGVTFSLEPDRASVESSFSLTEDGAALPGEFSWDGRSLIFSPFYSIKPNSEYRLSVSNDARTTVGLSLDEPFEVDFSTKAECLRPYVLSTTPAHGGIILPGTYQVAITFSEPIDVGAFSESVSLSPGISGIWRMDEKNSVASFTPLEPWVNGAEYEVTVSSSVMDCCGNRMGEDLSFKFTAGDDVIAPELILLDAVNELGSVVSALEPDDGIDGVAIETRGWERNWRLLARFSEPVLVRSIDAHVECAGGASLRRLTTGEIAEVVEFSLESLPEWGGRFSIRFDLGIEDADGNQSKKTVTYRFVADGPESRPPRFVGVRIPLAPGALLPADRELTAFSVDQPYETIAIASDASRFPIGIATRVSFECYFELAQNASLDKLPLMECLRTSSTNGTLDFSATRISLGGLDYAQPYDGWNGFALALVEGTLTNRVASGVFTIQFAAGLFDSSGNVNASVQRLALLK